MKKQFKTKKACDLLGFQELNVSVGLSAMFECVFFKTNFDHVYITDYDLNKLEDLEEKGLSMLFYNDGKKIAFHYISNEFMDNRNYLQHEIKSFINYLNN